MKNLVNDNENLNIVLNEIVNKEINNTLDKMIEIVEMWNRNTNAVSCEGVINMLKTNKRK